MRKTVLALLLTAPLAYPAKKDGEWGKGLSFTTDWKAAIKEARETGKMLFIYNGWERAGI